jgi:hypothetical protein
MASFCGSCGFPLGANGAFCPNCGSRQQQAASGPPPAQPMQPMAAPVAAKGGSGLKVVMVIFGCLLIGGVAVIGGLYYVAHRVKQAVVQKAESMGVDVPAITQPVSTDSSSSAVSPAVSANICNLLSAQEVSSLIGEPIERAENADKGDCNYYGPAGLYNQLANTQMSNQMKRADAPGATPDAQSLATAADQLANGIGAAAGQTGSNGEMPLLMVIVGDGGKAQLAAMSAARTLFGVLGKAKGSELNMTPPIPGLGDKAYRLPKLGLNVLKGDTIIRIVPGPFPDSDAKTIEVARVMLKKI